MSIEFISYSGKYPCLCNGIFKVKIDGKEIIFSNSGKYCDYDEYKNEYKYAENCYPAFWESGGSIRSDGNWNMWAEHAPWVSGLYDGNKKYFPKEILDLMDELIDLFNKNVPQGCCGGCI